MLDLRRLRLLRELHARGTIAAVADALRYTPSAVSQQLAVLEREAGPPPLGGGGRGGRPSAAGARRPRGPADRRRAGPRRTRRGAAAAGRAGRSRPGRRSG